MKERQRKILFISAGSAVSASMLFLGLRSCINEQQTNIQPLIGASPENGSENQDITPEMLEKKGWNPHCQIINNPDASDYNPNLPKIPNAFRAVEAAGDPEVIENGPYLLIPGQLGSSVREYFGLDSGPQEITDMGGFNPEKNPVHNGDKICVKANNGSSIYPARHHRVVFQSAVRQEIRRSAQRSLGIKAAIRAKQGF